MIKIGVVVCVFVTRHATVNVLQNNSGTKKCLFYYYYYLKDQNQKLWVKILTKYKLTNE